MPALREHQRNRIQSIFGKQLRSADNNGNKADGIKKLRDKVGRCPGTQGSRNNGNA
jgi:hypothetical protein